MLVIRTKDLNNCDIPEILYFSWKIQHSITNLQIKANKHNLFIEKMSHHFKLSKNELLIIKCILWSERITANGISSHLLQQKSNVLKTIKTLINKKVLETLDDRTFNATPEFQKKWTAFIGSSKLLESAYESYYDLEADLSNLINLFKLANKKLK